MALRWGNLRISPGYLAIALAPLCVILISGMVFDWYGGPGAAESVVPTADAHLEAAARLRMLATWFVMASLAIGSIAYFLIGIFRFNMASAALLAVAYVALAILGIAWVSYNEGSGRAEMSLGEETICIALGDAVPAAGPAEAAARAPQTAARAAPSRPCAVASKYRWLRALNGAQLYLLLLVLPAMVLGAISTLGANTEPAAAPSAEEPPSQAARLKTYLYLSAALLVCGLLFLSALLRWPGSALRGTAATSFLAHVDAYLLYWGATYSVFIASFYVPVAAFLSRQIGPVAAMTGRAPAGKKSSGGGDDTLGIIDLLKIAAAVFAPIIAALLGNVVKL